MAYNRTSRKFRKQFDHLQIGRWQYMAWDDSINWRGKHPSHVFFHIKSIEPECLIRHISGKLWAATTDVNDLKDLIERLYSTQYSGVFSKEGIYEPQKT